MHGFWQLAFSKLKGNKHKMMDLRLWQNVERMFVGVRMEGFVV